MPHGPNSAGKGVSREGRGTYKRPSRAAKGFTRLNGMKAITISFDPDTFDHIAECATKRGVPFSEVVQTYCEWGVENDE